jgi:dephospho-CoA kinase
MKVIEILGGPASGKTRLVRMLSDKVWQRKSLIDKFWAVDADTKTIAVEEVTVAQLQHIVKERTLKSGALMVDRFGQDSIEIEMPTFIVTHQTSAGPVKVTFYDDL